MPSEKIGSFSSGLKLLTPHVYLLFSSSNDEKKSLCGSCGRRSSLERALILLLLVVTGVSIIVIVVLATANTQKGKYDWSYLSDIWKIYDNLFLVFYCKYKDFYPIGRLSSLRRLVWIFSDIYGKQTSGSGFISCQDISEMLKMGLLFKYGLNKRMKAIILGCITAFEKNDPRHQCLSLIFSLAMMSQRVVSLSEVWISTEYGMNKYLVITVTSYERRDVSKHRQIQASVEAKYYWHFVRQTHGE